MPLYYYQMTVKTRSKGRWGTNFQNFVKETEADKFRDECYITECKRLNLSEADELSAEQAESLVADFQMNNYGYKFEVSKQLLEFVKAK